MKIKPMVYKDKEAVKKRRVKDDPEVVVLSCSVMSDSVQPHGL